MRHTPCFLVDLLILVMYCCLLYRRGPITFRFIQFPMLSVFNSVPISLLCILSNLEYNLRFILFISCCVKARVSLEKSHGAVSGE